MSEQAPEPDTAVTPEPETAVTPEPTPTVPEAEASFSNPAGTAAPSAAGPAGAAPAAGDSPLDRPEVQVGLAFAGGLVVATILKRLGR